MKKRAGSPIFITHMAKDSHKPTSKQALYSSISCHAKAVIKRLFELSQSKNENVALGACKTLLNKSLPDIKSVEVTQSSVVDSLISEELDRYKPVANKDKTFDDMTQEEKEKFARSMIDAGEEILGIGDYTPEKRNKFATMYNIK